MTSNPNIKLFNAIINNDQNLFDRLITNKNIDFNYQIKNNLKWKGYTLLLLAVIFNRFKMVQELLKQNPDNLDRNIPDRCGNTPIIMSVLSGNVEHEEGINYDILKLLLEDPYVDKGFIKKSNKSDPMTCALWVEDKTIIEMLLDYDVPVYWEHLDKWRRNYYNQIVKEYYYPYQPKGRGYMKLLEGYSNNDSSLSE